MSGRIAVVGSMNADLAVRTGRLPHGGETVTGSELEVNPGGKSSNQAAAAARLGAEVSLIARVGADANGDLLLAEAQRAGVDISRIVRDEDAATGTAMIAVDDAGENFIIISPGANGRLSPEDVQRHDAVITSSALLCLCLEVDQAVVLAATTRAAQAGVPVLLNLSPSAPVPDALLAATEILLINEHELRDLAGVGIDSPEVAESLSDKGIQRAVITLGAEGALVIDGDRSERVPGVRVQAVDTTGCGDAFTGALAHRLVAGDDLLTAAEVAVRVAGFAATRPGAQRSYPRPAELAAFTA